MFFRSSLNETLNVSWSASSRGGPAWAPKWSPNSSPFWDPKWIQFWDPKWKPKSHPFWNHKSQQILRGASSHDSPSRASSRKRSTRNLMYALMGLQAHPPRDPGAYNIICADLHLILGICLANNNFHSTLRHDPKRLPRDFGRVLVEY